MAFCRRTVSRSTKMPGTSASNDVSRAVCSASFALLDCGRRSSRHEKCVSLTCSPPASSRTRSPTRVPSRWWIWRSDRHPPAARPARWLRRPPSRPTQGDMRSAGVGSVGRTKEQECISYPAVGSWRHSPFSFGSGISGTENQDFQAGCRRAVRRLVRIMASPPRSCLTDRSSRPSTRISRRLRSRASPRASRTAARSAITA